MIEDLHFDEDTLHKVYQSMLDSHISMEKAEAAINRMLNAGILFRERVKS